MSILAQPHVGSRQCSYDIILHIQNGRVRPIHQALLDRCQKNTTNRGRFLILHLPSTLPTLLAIQLNRVQYEYRRAPLRRKLCEYCKINESTLQCTCDSVICSYSHQISEQIIVVTINRSQKRNAMHVTARDALSKREYCSTESNLSTRQPLPWPNPQLKACAIVNYTPSHPPPSLPPSLVPSSDQRPQHPLCCRLARCSVSRYVQNPSNYDFNFKHRLIQCGTYIEPIGHPPPPL